MRFFSLPGFVPVAAQAMNEDNTVNISAQTKHTYDATAHSTVASSQVEKMCRPTCGLGEGIDGAVEALSPDLRQKRRSITGLQNNDGKRSEYSHSHSDVVKLDSCIHFQFSYNSLFTVSSCSGTCRAKPMQQLAG
jgi:hypothetical protein